MQYMRKALNLVVAMIMAQMNAWAGDVTIMVRNQEKVQRQEVIEVDLKTVTDKLGLKEGETFIVKNPIGQQVDYQITHDQKLLIDAAVRPSGTMKFLVTKGTPKQMKVWVQGRMYPDREDDIAWENDRGAYRVYGPALQKTGERSFGIDVWTKNTPDLDVGERYLKNDYAWVHLKELRKKGKMQEAKEYSLNTSFHLDHGTGLDCYNVGPSLGCGTPALMDGEKLILPYCYKDYDILDNGPLRFTVDLVYGKEKVRNDSVTEHRLISLDKGSNFNKMTVWYEGLSKPATFCSGVVIHSDDKESVVLGKEFVQYADPTDGPDRHNFQIYVAALFPNGAQTRKLMYAKPENGIEGHAIGVVKGLKDKEKYTYYFGSAWSAYDVRTQQERQLRIDEFLNALHTPLQITVQ